MQLIIKRSLILKLIILSIPFGGIKVFWPQLNMPTFVFFVYLIVFILSTSRNIHNKSAIVQLTLLVLLYGLILIVSFMNYVEAPPGAYSFFRQFPIHILLFYFLSIEIIAGNISPREYMQWFIGGTILLSLMFIADFRIEYDIVGRARIMGLNPNMMAVICSMSIIMTLNQLAYTHTKTKWKGLYVVFLPIFFYMTIASGSRGGVLGLMLALFIYFFFRKRGIAKKLNNYLKGIIIIVSFVIIILSNEMLYSRLFQEDPEFAFSRIRIWENAFLIVKENLLFGVGIFKYLARIVVLWGHNISIHNEFLTILVYTGLLGLGVFLTFIGKTISSAFTYFKEKDDPVYLSLGAIVLVTLFKGGGALLTFSVWIVLALIFASKHFLLEHPSPQTQNDR